MRASHLMLAGIIVWPALGFLVLIVALLVLLWWLTRSSDEPPGPPPPSLADEYIEALDLDP